MQQYLVIIKADTNDADYIHQLHEVSFDEYREEWEPLLFKVGKALKEHGGSWARGDVGQRMTEPSEMYKGELTEEEIDFFNDIAPYGEHGIHSIDSIKVYSVREKLEFY